jgi:transcriptional regulator with XRE-family HTH domain
MTNWQELIAYLCSRGWTQMQIAARVDVSQSVISDLARGASKEPRFSTADGLMRLHRSVKARELRAGKKVGA